MNSIVDGGEIPYGFLRFSDAKSSFNSSSELIAKVS